MMRRTYPRNRCQTGLSLIEVLVAFVILGMVMAVIMRINATSFRNHEVSNAYLQALRVAESRMVAEGFDRTTLTLNRIGEESSGMRWEFSRQPYLGWDEERLQELQAIPVEERILVSWGEDPFSRQLSFTRINLIPR